MPRLTRFLFFNLLFISSVVAAQPDRWQQKIKYTMNVNMDVNTNRFTGTQKIDYFNQSPDTLNKMFMHFTAKQYMNKRSRLFAPKN